MKFRGRSKRRREAASSPGVKDLHQALVQVGIDPKRIRSYRWERSTDPSLHAWDGSSWVVLLDTEEVRIRHEFDPIFEGDLPWVLDRNSARG